MKEKDQMETLAAQLMGSPTKIADGLKTIAQLAARKKIEEAIEVYIKSDNEAQAVKDLIEAGTVLLGVLTVDDDATSRSAIAAVFKHMRKRLGESRAHFRTQKAEIDASGKATGSIKAGIIAGLNPAADDDDASEMRGVIVGEIPEGVTRDEIEAAIREAMEKVAAKHGAVAIPKGAFVSPIVGKA